MSHIWKFNTITEMLAQKFADKQAVSDDSVTLTYNELALSCRRAADALIGRGVKRGDHVLIELENCTEFVTAFFALISIGAVPVLMHVKLDHHETAPIIKLCRPVCRIRRNAPENGSGDGIPVLSAKELVRGRDTAARRALQGCSLKETAFVLLSSGTTGIPKCIPKTYGDMVTFFNSYLKCVGIDGNTRSLITGPLTHYLGFIILFGTLISGGTAFMTQFLSPVDIINNVRENHINTLSMVPSMLRLCVRYNELESDSCMLKRALVIGGSKSTEEDIVNAIDCFSCPVINLYGSSEAVITYSVYRSRDDAVRHSEGVPVGRFDKIKIEGGKEKGELLVKGPYMFSSYLGMEGEREKFFTHDGYYRTGDMAFIDSNGTLFVSGRCREMINRCGEKIIPSELEGIIQSHRKVCECAVCGLKDKLLGERIAVFIEQNGNEPDISSEELKKYMKECGIADFKLPDEVIITASLPKTDSGKVNKQRLVEGYLNGKLNDIH